MPTVKYQPDQVRTEVAGRTQARTVNNGGQQLAQGINSLASAANQLNQKATVAEAQEAATGFERDKNDLFFNPDSGYFNTQGRTAYDTAGDTSKQLDKLKEQYASKLSPQARQEFERVASAQITRSNADIMRHSSKNLQAWEQANIEAEVENTLENSALYWNSSDNLKVQRALGTESVLEAAQIQGLSPEATNEKLENYNSAFATNVIKSAAQSSAAEGEAAMEKYGKSLEGPDRVNLQEMLTERKEAESVRDISREAVLKGTNLVADYGDRPDARAAILAEVDKIEDPDSRKATKSQAMYQLNLKKQADAETRGAIYEEAERVKFSPDESIESFKANNSELWGKMTTKQRQSLEATGKIQTNYVTFSDLSLMDETEIAKIEPSDYFDVLAPTERKQLIEMVKDARGPNAANKASMVQTGRSRTAQTSATVEQIFGQKSSWNDKETKRVNAFYGVVDSEAKMQEAQKGSPLTSQEYTDILHSFTRKYVVEGGSFFGLLDDEQDLTDIPADDLKSVSEYLNKNNIPATVSNIFKAYEQARQ
jgi:hypothetical protein